MAEPIDLQNVLSKTQATEKVAKLEKSRPELAQKQGAADFQVKVEDKKKKVRNTENKDEVIIRKEQKNNEEDQKRKKNKSKEKDENRQDNEEPTLNQEDENVRHIDLLA